jgi:hypothetical protein
MSLDPKLAKLNKAALAHVWGEMVVRAALVARISPVLRGFLSDARRCF